MSNPTDHVEEVDQAQKPETTDKSPSVRVVDRRWWARGETATTDDQGARKPTYVEELEQRLQDSGTQLQSVLAEHRRSLEEFEQIKVRIRREVARDVERGRRVLLSDLLDVLDNLERAIAAAREQTQTSAPEAIDRVDKVDKVTRGVELVRDQFLGKLTSYGVTRLKTLGEPFDAARHEAVSMAPVADASQDGLIVAVVRDGYAIGEEILRPASVVVGKHS